MIFLFVVIGIFNLIMAVLLGSEHTGAGLVWLDFHSLQGLAVLGLSISLLTPSVIQYSHVAFSSLFNMNNMQSSFYIWFAWEIRSNPGKSLGMVWNSECFMLQVLGLSSEWSPCERTARIGLQIPRVTCHNIHNVGMWSSHALAMDFCQNIVDFTCEVVPDISGSFMRLNRNLGNQASLT